MLSIGLRWRKKWLEVRGEGRPKFDGSRPRRARIQTSIGTGGVSRSGAGVTTFEVRSRPGRPGTSQRRHRFKVRRWHRVSSKSELCGADFDGRPLPRTSVPHFYDTVPKRVAPKTQHFPKHRQTLGVESNGDRDNLPDKWSGADSCLKCWILQKAHLGPRRDQNCSGSTVSLGEPFSGAFSSTARHVKNKRTFGRPRVELEQWKRSPA